MPRNRRKNVRNNRNSRNDWRNITSEDSEVDLDDSDDSDDFNNCSDTFSLLEKKRNLRKRPTSKNFYDRNNVNEAGCSIVDNNSNNSKRKLRSGTVKRKCKERTKIKRLRMYDADSDSSDSSDIQPVRNRRHRLINMDSSGSSSDQIIRPSVPRLLCPMWSDDTDSSEDQHDGRSTHLSSDFSSEIRYRTRLHDNIGMNNFVRISINNPTSTSSSSSLCNFSSSSSSSSFTSNNTFNFSSVSSDISNESSVYNSTNSNRITEQMPSSDSDSSEADGEKCAICLKKFKKQRIGNPSKCDHSFCLHCLQEWSKTSTTCPVDRLVFDAIVVRNEVNGNILERIEVQTCNFGTFPTTDVEEVFINDSIICEVCGSGDDGETLLLCDLCNLGYHMACLHPPLSTIPEGSWYCPPCRELRNNSSIHLNEVIEFSIDESRLPSNGCIIT